MNLNLALFIFRLIVKAEAQDFPKRKFFLQILLSILLGLTLEYEYSDPDHFILTLILVMIFLFVAIAIPVTIYCYYKSRIFLKSFPNSFRQLIQPWIHCFYLYCRAQILTINQTMFLIVVSYWNDEIFFREVWIGSISDILMAFAGLENAIIYFWYGKHHSSTQQSEIQWPLNRQI